MIHSTEIFYFLINFLTKIISGPSFILAISIISFLIKTFIFFLLIKITKKKLTKHLLLLFLIIIGSSFSDISWIMVLLNELSIIFVKFQYQQFLIRISWGFYSIYYLSLSLLLELMANKSKKTLPRQKLFIFISATFALFGIILSLIHFNCYNASMRPFFEQKIFMLQIIYSTCILMGSSVFLTLNKIKSNTIPRILQRQLKIFIKFIITPIIFADIIQLYPFSIITTNITNTYAAVGITSILITYGIFHCTKKIMNIRFLNLKEHVEQPDSIKKFHFIDDFKNVIKEFTTATHVGELDELTKNFFNTAFSIPKNRTRLYVKNISKTNYIKNSFDLNINSNNKTEELLIDNFVNTYTNETPTGILLRKNKIVIADEVEFSNFYEESEELKKLVELMQAISADILIPIFEGNSISGYIIVEKYARINNENKNAPFYSSFERDQMLVYANYLGNIIKLFQTRSLNQIILQEKELKEEVYGLRKGLAQQNEILDYLQTNFENTNKEKIGIIIYKNKTFHVENKLAEQLIQVNLNIHNGDIITKTIKNLAIEANELKEQKKSFIKNKNGENISIIATPRAQKNSVIIAVYKSDLQDIFENNINKIYKNKLAGQDIQKNYQNLQSTKNYYQEPQKYQDNKGNYQEFIENFNTYEYKKYILCLETTTAGRLINDFIPSYEQNLVSTKINLLKTSLSKNTILINSCITDAQKISEIIKTIREKTILYTIDAKDGKDTKQQKNNKNKKQEENLDFLIDLFGVNPYINYLQKNEFIHQTKTPILEELDSKGVLLIKNIEHIGPKAQEHLLQFIKYGYFKIFKGEKQYFSDVIVICHSTLDLSKTLDKAALNKPTLDITTLDKMTPHKITTDKTTLSEELLSELVKNTITIPSPKTLTEKQIHEIINEFSTQSIKSQELQAVFELTESEKRKISNHHSNSFYEIKNKVQEFLIKKSKENNIYQNEIIKEEIIETQENNFGDNSFNNNFNNIDAAKIAILTKEEQNLIATDNQLAEAIKLGKNALKDAKIMALLWNKFKNQNKIAAILGVNRSSINRRCKEYNLF